MRGTLTAIAMVMILAGPALAQDNPAQVEITTTNILSSDTLGAAERARTLVTRGLAREKLGRSKDAYDDFTYALSLHALPVGEIARARFDRGVVLEEMNRTQDAIDDYTAAINLQSGFAAALNNRGNAYRRLGQLDNAARDYSASLNAGNAQPEYPVYGLGQIAEALGHVREARAYYQQALTFNPHFDLAAQRLAVLNDPTLPDPQPLAGIELKPAITQAEQPKPAPIAPAPAFPPAPKSGPGWVQLGAFRDEATAAAEWGRIAPRSDHLFDDLSPHITAVEVPGKGRFFRLQAGPLPDAQAACAKLAAQGFACVLVHGEPPEAEASPAP